MSLVLMRRQMKYLTMLVWVFVAIFVLGAIFSFNGSGAGRSSRGGDYLFARVDGQEVTKEQFSRQLGMMREQYKSFASFGQPATIQQYADEIWNVRAVRR